MSTCPRCGTLFSCGMVEGASDQAACWCTQLPALMPVPAKQEASSAECYCQDCLRVMLAIHKIQRRTSNASR